MRTPSTPDAVYSHRQTCRACGSRRVQTFLDFGRMPLAGNFLLESEVGHERAYPLRISLCHDCSLVQVLDVVSPKIIFGDYRYLSSVTSTLRTHFERYAADLARELRGVGDPFVVEIGCNDGVLLKPLQDRGIRVLGVEPAENVAKVARGRGLNVLNGFFDEELAERIRREHGPATAVLANNVFAHIDDLKTVVRGIVNLLSPGGIFVFEVHYLRELLRLMQYDFFYHEHLCYYSLTALVPFLERHGLHVYDVKPISIHSGSIRVHARRSDARPRPTGKLVSMLSREHEERIGTPSTYGAFARRVPIRSSCSLESIDTRSGSEHRLPTGRSPDVSHRMGSRSAKPSPSSAPRANPWPGMVHPDEATRSLVMGKSTVDYSRSSLTPPRAGTAASLPAPISPSCPSTNFATIRRTSASCSPGATTVRSSRRKRRSSGVAGGFSCHCRACASSASVPLRLQSASE